VTPPDARIEPVNPFAELDAVFTIYGAALGAPFAARETLAWRDETLPRHAARSDFDFLGAHEGDDLVGFTYGYTGAYGQWWTDRVARAMDDATRATWLDPPHFEVVELHVRPDRQRTGIGTRLLDALLARQPHARALLTADPTSASALPFYEQHGWEPLADVELVLGAGTRVVLGRRVRATAERDDQAASRSSSRPSRSSRHSSV
jgi:GNAT superfamily N-acetyltransferase